MDELRLARRDDLVPAQVDWVWRNISDFWPIKDVLPDADLPDDVYPLALVKSWHRTRKRGTDALRHERLLVGTGWLLYLTLVLLM